MKLYDTPLAPNPRRVRWFLAEKGIEDRVEIVRLNLMEGEHKTADYLGKAGLPNVPALELDDGTTITESLAVCRYLESLFPEPSLFGRDAREQAVIEMWTRRAELMLALPMMQGVRHSHPAMARLEAQNPAFADYNLAVAERGMAVFDRRLGESEWIAGEAFSIADIIAFIGVDFGRMIKRRPPRELTHLNRWAEAMRARPAASAGMS